MNNQGISARGPPCAALFVRGTVRTTVDVLTTLEHQAKEQDHANPVDQQ